MSEENNVVHYTVADINRILDDSDGLNDTVVALSSTVNSATNSITSIDGQLTDLINTRIPGIESEIAAATSDLVTQSALDAVTSDLGDAVASISSIDGRVITIEDKIDVDALESSDYYYELKLSGGKLHSRGYDRDAIAALSALGTDASTADIVAAINVLLTALTATNSGDINV